MNAGPKEWEKLQNEYKLTLETYLGDLKNVDDVQCALIKDILEALALLAKAADDDLMTPHKPKNQPGPPSDPDVAVDLPNLKQTSDKFEKGVSDHFKNGDIDQGSYEVLTRFTRDLRHLIKLEVAQKENEELKRAATEEAYKKTKNMRSELGIGAVVLAGLSLTMFFVGGFTLLPSLLAGLAAAVPVVGAKIYVDAKRTPKERYQNEQNQVNAQLKQLEDTLPSDDRDYLVECENLVLEIPSKKFDEKGDSLDEKGDSLSEQIPDRLEIRKDLVKSFEEVRTTLDQTTRKEKASNVTQALKSTVLALPIYKR